MNGAGPSAMVVEKDVVGPSAMVVESDSVGPSPMVTEVGRYAQSSRPPKSGRVNLSRFTRPSTSRSGKQRDCRTGWTAESASLIRQEASRVASLPGRFVGLTSISIHLLIVYFTC